MSTTGELAHLFRALKAPAAARALPKLADRARALGAAFLKKPFFPADLENVLCGFYALRALNPQRPKA